MKLLYLLLGIFLTVLLVGSIKIKREQFEVVTKNIDHILQKPADETKEQPTVFLFLNKPKGCKKYHEHDLTANGVQKRKCDAEGLCVVDARMEC